MAVFQQGGKEVVDGAGDIVAGVVEFLEGSPECMAKQLAHTFICLG